MPRTKNNFKSLEDTLCISSEIIWNDLNIKKQTNGNTMFYKDWFGKVIMVIQ